MIAQLVPSGWVFCAADFSVVAHGNGTTGTALLIRDSQGRKDWHKLSEGDQERIDLHIWGRGETLEDAVKNAAEKAKNSEPVPTSGDL